MRGTQVTVGSSITRTLSAIARGCGSGNDQGTDEGPLSSGELPIDDLSQWIDEQGALIASCHDVCAALIGNTRVTGPHQQIAQSNSLGPLSTGRRFPQNAYGEGRRHTNWQASAQGPGSNAIGKWLARASSSEATSVARFHHLALELERQQAPWQFIQKTRQAMANEMRHARRMSSLAERWGAAPGTIALRRIPERSLFELALENAEAGCAKESYSALVATVQARRASDPLIRATLQVVSKDELRHTTLAWDLHGWLLSRLSAGESQLVTRHLESSLARLTEPQDSEMSGSAAQLSVLGLPSQEEHLELALQMGVQVRQLQLCA